MSGPKPGRCSSRSGWVLLHGCDGDHDVICCSVAFLSCDVGLVELWSVIGVACCFDGLMEVVQVRTVSSGCAGKAVQ